MHRSVVTRRPPPYLVQTDSNLDMRYWTQRLAVSRALLTQAVGAVGRDPDDVARFIEHARTAHGSVAAPAAEDGGDDPPDDGPVNSRPVVPDAHALTRLQYVSRAAPDLTPEAVRAIMSWSVVYNARSAITGALMFTGRHFTQVLEGPRDTLHALMDAIRRDARHRDVRMLGDAPLETRRFGDWAMVLVEDPGMTDLL